MHRSLRVAAAIAVAGLTGLAAGCATSARAAPTPRPTSRPGPATPAVPLAFTPDPPAPHTLRPVLPPAPTLPDGTRRLLPGHRLVAFYGAAGAPALGILGTGSPEAVWPQLARQAREFRTGRRPRVLPAYELITFVATSGPGDAGTYARRVPDATIATYAAAARRHHALLILDIQPGRGDFLTDAKTLAPWLRRPDVGLALDPEWKLDSGQLPLRQIGHTDAASVNRVSRWLDRLTAATRLPQKLLLVHQFTTDMIWQRELLAPRRHLATVLNMDGFGSQEAKLSSYQRIAAHRHFPLGLKLFYAFDVNRFTARQVLALSPRPAVIEYQ